MKVLISQLRHAVTSKASHYLKNMSKKYVQHKQVRYDLKKYVKLLKLHHDVKCMSRQDIKKYIMMSKSMS